MQTKLSKNFSYPTDTLGFLFEHQQYFITILKQNILPETKPNIHILLWNILQYAGKEIFFLKSITLLLAKNIHISILHLVILYVTDNTIFLM